MQFTKVLDLTHPLEEGMLTFEASWHPRVSVQQLGRIGLEGRESRKLEIGTHTGTHVDSPLHFMSGGAGIDETSPKILLGEVSIVDFSHMKENQVVPLSAMKKVPVTERMILRFGWSKHWGTRKFYHGYPHLTVESARYLVEHGVKLLGYDIPSPDDSRIELTPETLGTSVDSPVHKVFLSKGIALVEYLANLDQIKELDGWHIVALPLKITGADGSPARVLLFK